MNTINEYKNRFYNLLETTIGDVKPLISEDDSKGFCLKKYKDTSNLNYKRCMFEGVTKENFINLVHNNANNDNRIYKVYGSYVDYVNGKPVYFKDSSGKQVFMIQTSVVDTGGVPLFLDDPILKTILDYMVANKYIASYDKDSPGQTLRELPSNISKKGPSGEIIVTLPAAPKNATGPSPITKFTYWPKAHIYYYDKNKPTDYIFTDDGNIDQTLLTLIQNRK